METTDSDATDYRFWEMLALFAYFFGAIAIAVYSFGIPKTSGWPIFGTLFIVGTSAWLAGTALGFLFGIPRVRSVEAVSGGEADRSSVVPNTNLEQISDWLTKIIVGATLVQLGPLSDSIGKLSVTIGNSLGAPPPSHGAVVAGGILVWFFFGGFLWGYLWCSLRIFREMQALIQRERVVRESEMEVQSLHRAE